MIANWATLVVSVVAITVSICGISYTQWKTGRRDTEQWRRDELWKLTAGFLSLSTERQSELLDYSESFIIGHRGPDRPVTASEKLWQMELFVQQFRLVDAHLAESAKAIYDVHRAADARSAAQDPRDGPISEAEERIVPHLEDLHNDLVQQFRVATRLCAIP